MKKKPKEKKSVAEMYKAEFDMFSFSDTDNEAILEEKKLKAEILLLKEELTGIYEKKIPKRRSPLKWLEDNTNRILIISGFFGAALGLVKPAYDYITNAEKHEKAKFNGEMLNLVKGLSDESPIKRERNLNMLTYYNPELVIPFFLNDIDFAPFDSTRNRINEPGIDKIKEAIKISWDNISESGHFGLGSLKKEVAQEIYSATNRIYGNIFIEFDEVNQCKFVIFTDIMNLLNLWNYNSSFSDLTKIIKEKITNSSLTKEMKDHYIKKIKDKNNE